MDKNREIISELQNFFGSNAENKAFNATLTVLDKITITNKTIGIEKKANCKFTFVQVLKLLILFPFFSVKNAFHYTDSSLGKWFVCKKDMFYRFMNNSNVN